MTLDITILNNLILEVVKPGLKEANQMAQGHGMSYYKAKSKPSCPAAWDVVLLGSAGAEVAYMFVPGCMCVRVHMCVYACACAYGMCVTLSESSLLHQPWLLLEKKPEAGHHPGTLASTHPDFLPGGLQGL